MNKKSKTTPSNEFYVKILFALLALHICPCAAFLMPFLTHNGSEVNEYSFSVYFGLLAAPYGSGITLGTIQFSALSQKRSIDAKTFQFSSNQLFP